jgi:hypothetical protein
MWVIDLLHVEGCPIFVFYMMCHIVIVFFVIYSFLLTS